MTHLADDPETIADELARTIAARPPDAVRATKQLVRDNAARPLRDAVDHEALAQTHAFAHPDFGARLDRWRRSRAPD